MHRSKDTMEFSNSKMAVASPVSATTLSALDDSRSAVRMQSTALITCARWSSFRPELQTSGVLSIPGTLQPKNIKTTTMADCLMKHLPIIRVQEHDDIINRLDNYTEFLRYHRGIQ